MNPLPPSMSASLATQRRRDLLTTACRAHTVRHLRRVRRWASGWFDRAIPSDSSQRAV